MKFLSKIIKTFLKYWTNFKDNFEKNLKYWEKVLKTCEINYAGCSKSFASFIIIRWRKEMSDSWNKEKYILQIFLLLYVITKLLEAFLHRCISLTIPVLYHSLPCFLKNEMTAALQLPSSAKHCLLSRSFCPGNVWKSDSARLGECVGCGKTDWGISSVTGLIRHVIWRGVSLHKKQISFERFP